MYLEEISLMIQTSKMFKINKITTLRIGSCFINDSLWTYRTIINLNYQNHQCWNSSQMITDLFWEIFRLSSHLISNSKLPEKINDVSTWENYKMQPGKYTLYNKLHPWFILTKNNLKIDLTNKMSLIYSMQ